MLPRSGGMVLGAFGALLVVLGGLLLATGVPLGQAAGVSVLVAVGSLGGGVLWGLLRGRRVDVLELVGMGAAIFAALYALLSVGAAGLGLAAPGWLVPLAITVPVLGWWVVTSARGEAGFTARAPRVPIASAVVGVGAFCLLNAAQFGRYALGPDATLAGYLPDLYLFESMSHALASFGPAESGLMAGWPLRYHWLTYALAGSLSDDAGLWPFVALTRVVPLLAAIVLAALGASWSSRRARYRWTPLLAVLLLLVATSIGPSANRVINWDSPSQSMSSAWLLALLLAVATFARGSLRRGVLAVVAVLAVATAAGKTSAAAVAVGAVVVACAAAFVGGRRAARRLVPVVAVTLVAIAVTYLLVSAGQASSGSLEPSPIVRTLLGRDTEPGELFGFAMLTLGLLLAVLPRWIGLVPLTLHASTRRGARLEYGLAVGSALTATGAVVLITSSVTNQSWFLDAACVPLAVVSAIGVDRAWWRTGLERPVLARTHVLLLVVAAVLSFASATWTRATYGSDVYPLGLPLPIVTLVVWLVAATLLSLVVSTVLARGAGGAATAAFVATVSSLLSLAAIAYGVTTPLLAGWAGRTYAVVGPDRIDVDALAPTLQWLAENAGPDDVVATDFDSLSLSSALTRRLPFAEWELHSSTLTPVGAAAEYDARRAAVAALVSGQQEPATSSLCRAGVDWLLVRAATTLPAALVSEVVRDDGRFVVVRLPC